MSVNDFGTHISVVHEAFEQEILQPGIKDLSVELTLWLNAKANERKWIDSGAPDGSLNGPRSFLAQQKMRDLAERSLVAAQRGYRPALASAHGRLSDYGNTLALAVEPLIDILAQNATDAWDPPSWLKADQLFITAAIPFPVVKLLNIFYVAIKRTEQKFLEARQNSGNLAEFQIPGQNLFITDQPPTEGANQNFIKAQIGMNANVPPPKSQIPTYVPIPTSTLNNLHSDTTQHIDETSTYLMQTALTEGSMWQAWVPVSIFQPATRLHARYMYRLGLLDLRAFSTQGRGRPRLIVRPSSVGERLLRDLNTRKLLH